MSCAGSAKGSVKLRSPMVLCTYGSGRARGERDLFDVVALDLLKRHSGIVWDPGRFRGIAPRREREEGGEPCGRTRPNPHALAMPGATQLTDVALDLL